MRRAGCVVMMLGLVLLPLQASAASRFLPVPRASEAPTALQIRVIRYTGGVHGKMVVELRNAGTREESFSAKGLYFVPEMPPERAPVGELG